MHTQTASDLQSTAHKLGIGAPKAWDHKGVLTLRFPSIEAFNATRAAATDPKLLVDVEPLYRAEILRAIDRVITRVCPNTGALIAE